MAKRFDPLEYNYRLTCDIEEAFNFQRIISNNDLSITDIIELAFWKKQKIWVMFIESLNLNEFLPEASHVKESYKIYLFAGEIKSAFEYELIIKRIVKDPEILIQLGA